MLERIKAAYNAFKEPEGFEFSGYVTPVGQKENTPFRTIVLGDGKAEYLPEMTEEELELYEKEQQGWNMKNFMKNFGL